MTKNELAMFSSDDGWTDAASEASDRILRGKLLKFSDWRWTCGKDGGALPEGTQLVAMGIARAWVMWEDGKPASYNVTPPGEPMPAREDLGFTEEAEWEKGPDGKPRDPLQNTRFVYLADPVTAEAFTYSTATMGGRGAVSELAEQVARMRYARPGAKPVVELCAEPMQTKFGKKSKPHLKVVRWVGGQPAEQRLVTNNPAKIAPAGDMSDEIPF